MIMTVAELRKFIATDEEDAILESRLQALELLIRAYTNNNFQRRAFRAVAVAVSDGHKLLTTASNPFKPGDTLQITESELMPGELVTVATVSNMEIVVKENLYDESGVVITKIVYPMDVKIGHIFAIGFIRFTFANAVKIGRTLGLDGKFRKSSVRDRSQFDFCPNSKPGSIPPDRISFAVSQQIGKTINDNKSVHSGCTVLS